MNTNTTNDITNEIASVCEMAFVVTTTEMFIEDKDFPDIDKVTRLMMAIKDTAPNLSANEVMAKLFEKYGIED